MSVALLAAACGGSDGSSPVNGPEDAPRAWEEVVATERAFAARALEVGGKQAFIEFISPQGILFRPEPVPGLSALEEGPEFGATLEWAPEVAFVSADGDLGFTSGPFRSTPDAGGVIGTGRYFTLWRRAADGSFRFEVDVGVTGPATGGFPASVRALGSLDQGDVGELTDDGGLLVLDGRMREHFAMGNVAGLRQLTLDSDLRVMRTGREPGSGPAAFLESSTRTAAGGGLVWRAMGARTADDNSLGYVYGVAGRPTPSDPAAGSGPVQAFLHVWRRTPDGGWALLVSLLGVPGT
jgi:ketosteroid isomerase-like protein